MIRSIDKLEEYKNVIRRGKKTERNLDSLRYTN